MQTVFNKQHDLKFFVIEYVDEENLIKREQIYLDLLWDNGVRCFNVSKSALNFSNNKTYNVFLLSPDKMIHGPITGMSQFARKHGLYKENLSSLINGKLKSYKGWQLIDNKSKRPQSKTVFHDFISPSGQIYTNITNLTEFGEMHNLKHHSLSKLANGKLKTLHGWKRIDR